MAQREKLISAFGGFRETVVYDDDRPNDLLIKTYEETEAYKERARVYSEQPPGKDLRHAAIIPQGVLDQSMREGWLNDKARWKKWANDPDNRHLRTWPGRL